MKLKTLLITAAVLVAAVFVGAGDRAYERIGPIRVQADLVDHADTPWGMKDIVGTYWLYGELTADENHAQISWFARSDYEGYRTSWPYGLQRFLKFNWEDTFQGYVAYVPRPDLPASAHQVVVLDIDAENATAELREGVVVTTGHFPFWEWSPDHYWQVHEVVPQFMSPRARGGDRVTPG